MVAHQQLSTQTQQDYNFSDNSIVFVPVACGERANIYFLPEGKFIVLTGEEKNNVVHYWGSKYVYKGESYRKPDIAERLDSVVLETELPMYAVRVRSAVGSFVRRVKVISPYLIVYPVKDEVIVRAVLCDNVFNPAVAVGKEFNIDTTITEDNRNLIFELVADYYYRARESGKLGKSENLLEIR